MNTHKKNYIQGKNMLSPVLFIDDDINILNSFKRLMNDEFNVTTAQSPENGLQIMEQNGPFAIVVSDMKMPGLSGVEVLSHAHKINPATVRVLLTGFAEHQCAIDAVNIGKVNKFLTKPCDLDTMASVLRAGIRQYQLTLSKKELLGRTYIGIVNVLSQILALVNPVAQNKANRLKKYCKHMINEMHFEDKFIVEIAAILSQLGCITIPQDVLERHEQGCILKEEELQEIKKNNINVIKLLMDIPIFEDIAEIISLSEKHLNNNKSTNDKKEKNIRTSGKILQVAKGLDRYIMSGVSPADAISMLRDDIFFNANEIVDSLNTYDFNQKNMIKIYIYSNELNTKMIIESDIYSSNGVLLIKKGQHVTYPILSSLINFSKNIGIIEPFAVLTPTDNK